MCAPRPDRSLLRSARVTLTKSRPVVGSPFPHTVRALMKPKISVNIRCGFKNAVQQLFSHPQGRCKRQSTTATLRLAGEPDAMQSVYLRERPSQTSGVVVVGFLRRGRVSANSASAHPHQVWAIPHFAARVRPNQLSVAIQDLSGVTVPAAIPRSPAALRWCPLSRRHHELG